tara:strand:- start:1666 stop:2382 length:717 start_codon:yes stop_codon:yes gene_type:complete
MNCIIIDDEQTARFITKTLCDQIKTLEVVAEFPDAIQAIKYLNTNEVDLIFLDIHMPHFTGLDFIKTLKKLPQIILTTSDPKFAIEAFEYASIVDYLLKPIIFSRFEKAIQKTEQHKIALELKTTSTVRIQDSDYKNDFYVNIDRRLIKIDLLRIYLIEAKGDYIHIKTEEQNYIVHSTLKKIEEKLPKELFLKVHRSFIINVKKIIDIEDNSVLIKKDIVPVSRSNRPKLMKRLDLL